MKKITTSWFAGALSFFYSGLGFAAVELKEVKESPLELSAFVFGGIGIFLIGIHFAGDHLKKLSGGKFQQLITRLSGNTVGIATSGATLGFITQSGKAAAFILSDFVQALSLIHISEPTRLNSTSRMPSSA